MIIEITDNVRYLKLSTGFMIVITTDDQEHKVPLIDLDALIIASNKVSYSNALLNKLCDLNIVVTICGKNYLPNGLLLPVVGKQNTVQVVQLQIEASKPFLKNIWRQIIKTKITNQAKVLQLHNKSYKDILQLVKEVKSGDSTYVESNAARLYFPRLFGDDFIRRTDDEHDYINAYLNFGYAIIRSQVARFLVSTGFITQLGIQHHNYQNPFCLVDDIMEIYRPFVDNTVYQMQPDQPLQPEHKKQLVDILQQPINPNSKQMLTTDIQEFVWSLRRSYEQGENDLKISNYII